MTISLVKGHLNQYADELPEPEIIVNQIIDCEKERDSKLNTENSFFSFVLVKDDSYWAKQSEVYLRIEKYIRKNPDRIPTWEVVGPLHYGMSLSEMESVIQQKFRDMVSSGKLMTEESLMELKDRTTLYPEERKGSNNLTRIWGADFLKTNLQENPTLDAAEHYLVVDEGATEIEVQVYNSDYPTLSIVKNAHILSHKIMGEKKAWDYRFSSELDELKYRDFKDPGNIIRDSNGIGWVVDTEWDAFDAPTLESNPYWIQDYVKKRFKVLAGDEYSPLCQIFVIPLSEIGLYE